MRVSPFVAMWASFIFVMSLNLAEACYSMEKNGVSQLQEPAVLHTSRQQVVQEEVHVLRTKAHLGLHTGFDGPLEPLHHLGNRLELSWRLPVRIRQKMKIASCCLSVQDSRK